MPIPGTPATPNDRPTGVPTPWLPPDGSARPPPRRSGTRPAGASPPASSSATSPTPAWSPGCPTDVTGQRARLPLAVWLSGGLGCSLGSMCAVPGSPEAGVLECHSAAGVLLSVVGGLELGRWEVPDRLQQPAMVKPVDPLQGGVLDLVEALPGAAPADEWRWLNQSTHSKVAYSTSSRPFQGPRRRMSSALYRPTMVSASALSYESPTEPTEETAPASASRSL
jgi:hypothetical protein